VRSNNSRPVTSTIRKNTLELSDAKIEKIKKTVKEYADSLVTGTRKGEFTPDKVRYQSPNFMQKNNYAQHGQSQQQIKGRSSRMISQSRNDDSVHEILAKP
jgi:hypothetical protein